MSDHLTCNHCEKLCEISSLHIFQIESCLYNTCENCHNEVKDMLDKGTNKMVDCRLAALLKEERKIAEKKEFWKKIQQDARNREKEQKEAELTKRIQEGKSVSLTDYFF